MWISSFWMFIEEAVFSEVYFGYFIKNPLAVGMWMF